MKVLVAQLDPTIGDFSGNVQKIIGALKHGQKEKVDVVLFSEMTLAAYPPEDLVLHDDFVRECEESLIKLLPHTKGMMAVVGLVRRNLASSEKPLLNSAAIIQDGKVVGFYDKVLLPTYDVFDERRYFEPGTEFPVWEWKGKTIGVTICEDVWQHAGYVGFTRYACDPILELKKKNIDLMLNLSASPYNYEKPDTRVKVCEKASKTLGCPVFLCAQVGGNEQLIFDGYSVFAKEGKLCRVAKGFEEDLMVVDLEAPACVYDFKYDVMADLYRALVMGTRDYFYKQGFKKGILGLSGGIDSALVACIAVDALGKENVYGLAMPSKFSSEGSIKDAQVLAKNLGMKCDVISIEGIFEAYLEQLVPLFEKKSFDVTEENLQARIRGMFLMALSNKHGYILLSTGNKSELALGYCTLYGDMAGGLGVIADVSKTQVYALSRWINRNQEIIPLSTIEKPPSAELKPNQKDSDSLPDYAVIDAVLQGYVEEFLSPEEIATKYKLEPTLVSNLVHRIHLAEYKRRQSAPGIRVTKKSFKVGRRYPIVQRWK